VEGSHCDDYFDDIDNEIPEEYVKLLKNLKNTKNI
jgi:hypothetical protein